MARSSADVANRAVGFPFTLDKRFKNARQQLGRYADAVIRYVDRQPAVDHTGPDVDPRS